MCVQNFTLSVDLSDRSLFLNVCSLLIGVKIFHLAAASSGFAVKKTAKYGPSGMRKKKTLESFKVKLMFMIYLIMQPTRMPCFHKHAGFAGKKAILNIQIGYMWTIEVYNKSLFAKCKMVMHENRPANSLWLFWILERGRLYSDLHPPQSKPHPPVDLFPSHAVLSLFLFRTFWM